MTKIVPRRRQPLFSFAVLADSHVTPEDGKSQSPWAANKLANARLKAVFAGIDALDPSFVVHLGDMVHPVPAQQVYGPAAARFHALAADLRAPLHLVPGNHDIGDKPTAWMPAALITDEALRAYRAAFGADYYAFTHDGCRGLVINAMLINSGLGDEQAQWAWLEDELARPVRTFVFIHYPPYLRAPDETEHYDNIAEPGRARLLSLLARGGVEAVFSGHVHNIFVNRHAGTDLYVLPATSAVRHDYMDLFPTAPVENEFGRDAREKLGFFLVDVFEDGHAAHFVRSHGQSEVAGAAARMPRPHLHPRAGLTAPLGVDLRHGWAEPLVIPISGVVDEFGRKSVRNDYLLSALAELGVARLRIPLADLMDAAPAGRLGDLAALGHRFVVFRFGLPDLREAARLTAWAHAIDAVEIVERDGALEDLAAGAAALGRETGLPVFLSPLRVLAHATAQGGSLAHVLRHGVGADESDPAAAQAEGLAGAVHAVGQAEPAFTRISAIAAAARAAGRRAMIHVRLAGDNPARMPADDRATAARVADAALAAFAAGDAALVVLDTFADHDRGYFPRLGLVDRACDPRGAGLCLKHLAAALAPFDPDLTEITTQGAARHLRQGERHLILILPDGAPALTLPADLSPDAQVRVLRLDTGAALAARRAASTLTWDEAAGWPVAVEITAPSHAPAGVCV